MLHQLGLGVSGRRTPQCTGPGLALLAPAGDRGRSPHSRPVPVVAAAFVYPEPWFQRSDNMEALMSVGSAKQ